MREGKVLAAITPAQRDVGYGRVVSDSRKELKLTKVRPALIGPRTHEVVVDGRGIWRNRRRLYLLIDDQDVLVCWSEPCAEGVALRGVVASDHERSPLTPKLLPWYVIPGTAIEFGFALTWEEAQRVAAHPYVASIRSLGSVQPGVLSGCPDTAQPPPEPECTEAREPTADKWSQRDEVIWSMAPGPHQVSIIVRGPGQLCTIECPSRSNTCPERDELFRYVEEWNARSQRCVRALIDELGGSATDERFFSWPTKSARR